MSDKNNNIPNINDDTKSSKVGAENAAEKEADAKKLEEEKLSEDLEERKIITSEKEAMVESKMEVLKKMDAKIKTTFTISVVLIIVAFLTLLSQVIYNRFDFFNHSIEENKD